MNRLTREQAEIVAAIDTEIAKRRWTDPLLYRYRPHRMQRLMHESKSQLSVLFSANRIGKSLAGLAEIIWRGKGVHPYKKVKKPPVHMWMVIPSFQFFDETFVQGLWRDWAPRDDSVIIKRGHIGASLVIQFDTGSTCTIMSQEMDLRKFMGAAIDFVWFDEKVDAQKFEESMVRIISCKGEAWYTATLVEGIGWEYEDLYLPGISGEDPDIVAYTAALCTRDPMAELEIGRPLLPPDHPMGNRQSILQMARRIPDPYMRDVRIFGEIKGRTGLILPYNGHIHLIPRFSIPDHWPIAAGVDPAFNGFAVTFQAINERNQAIVWEELFSRRESASTRASAIRQKVYRLHRPLDEVVTAYVDTANPQEVIELNERFDELGVPMVATSLELGKKAVKPGIERVQYLMQPDDELEYPHEMGLHPPIYGAPRLLIFDDLQSTWVDNRGRSWRNMSRHTWEMQRWQWKDPKPGQLEKDEPDDYQADGAHMLDAVRYLSMARMGYVEQKQEDDPDRYTGVMGRIIRQLGVGR
ncbi:MAG: hypothetical protein AMS18_00465 [Gemmatimonas sp. SG8_17]|nr:MAG: hypothetical protein AMS18_00465 [Gemmatimonas sp. SG8_17]